MSCKDPCHKIILTSPPMLAEHIISFSSRRFSEGSKNIFLSFLKVYLLPLKSECFLSSSDYRLSLVHKILLYVFTVGEGHIYIYLLFLVNRLFCKLLLYYAVVLKADLTSVMYALYIGGVFSLEFTGFLSFSSILYYCYSLVK